MTQSIETAAVSSRLRLIGSGFLRHAGREDSWVLAHDVFILLSHLSLFVAGVMYVCVASVVR